MERPPLCLGGASGIILPPVRRADVQATNLAFYFAALAMFAGGTAALWLLRHSKFGYGLRAIRANEEAAAVLGINTTWFKVAAFAAGAVLTGLAGGLQGLVNGSVLPEQTGIFDPYRSLEVIIICLIGGAGTVWGPMVGVFTLYAVQEALFGSARIGRLAARLLRRVRHSAGAVPAARHLAVRPGDRAAQLADVLTQCPGEPRMIPVDHRQLYSGLLLGIIMLLSSCGTTSVSVAAPVPLTPTMPIHLTGKRRRRSRRSASSFSLLWVTQAVVFPPCNRTPIAPACPLL